MTTESPTSNRASGSSAARGSAASICDGYQAAEAGIEKLKASLSAPEHSSLKHEADAIQTAFRQRRETLEHFMAKPPNAKVSGAQTEKDDEKH